MQEHSAIGERILQNVDDYADIARIVRYHHERIDGEGYPDGIAGDRDPTISRIIAVADAYNAMTSDRPYRDAMPSRVARLRLAQAADTQFDTSIVVAFEAVLATASEDYRLPAARLRCLRARRNGELHNQVPRRRRLLRSRQSPDRRVGGRRRARARAGSDPELVEDVVGVHLDGGFRNEQAFCDLSVG